MLARNQLPLAAKLNGCGVSVQLKRQLRADTGLRNHRVAVIVHGLASSAIRYGGFHAVASAPTAFSEHFVEATCPVPFFYLAISSACGMSLEPAIRSNCPRAYQLGVLPASPVAPRSRCYREKPFLIEASAANPRSASASAEGSGTEEVAIVIEPLVNVSMLMLPPLGSDRLVAGNGDSITVTSPCESPAETSKNT